MKKQCLRLSILFIVINFCTLAKDCSFIDTKVRLPKEISTYLDIAEVSSGKYRDNESYLSESEEISKGDNRKVKDSESPSYLDASGLLNITFANGETKNCTGNLTDTVLNRSSKILTSAEHCFVYNDKNGRRNYRVKIKSITWSTYTKDGELIRRSAQVLKTSRKSDTALLKLDQEVPFSKIKPFLFSGDLEDEEIGDIVDLYSESATLAGFSSDSYKGRSGRNLTYTEDLSYDELKRGVDSANRMITKVSAVSYGGASGGALTMSLSDTSNEELDLYENNGQRLFLGVSGSVRGLGQDESTYYISNSAIGSPETNVIGFKDFLNDGYLEYFTLNE